MLYGLITSQNVQFIDKQRNIQYSDYEFDSVQYTEAKISIIYHNLVVAYPSLQQSVQEKLPKLNISFFTLNNILAKRNEIFFPDKEKLANNVFMEINLDSFNIKVFYQTNEGVEIIQNKEFESTFTPTNATEDEYYVYLRQFNFLPPFKIALNLQNIEKFSVSPMQLYNNICQNFIADQIITNLALGGVYVVSKHLSQQGTLFQNYVKDRPYFQNLFKNLAIIIRDDYLSLFDLL